MRALAGHLRARLVSWALSGTVTPWTTVAAAQEPRAEHSAAASRRAVWLRIARCGAGLLDTDAFVAALAWELARDRISEIHWQIVDLGEQGTSPVGDRVTIVRLQASPCDPAALAVTYSIERGGMPGLSVGGELALDGVDSAERPRFTAMAIAERARRWWAERPEAPAFPVAPAVNTSGSTAGASTWAPPVRRGTVVFGLAPSFELALARIQLGGGGYPGPGAGNDVGSSSLTPGSLALGIAASAGIGLGMGLYAGLTGSYSGYARMPNGPESGDAEELALEFGHLASVGFSYRLGLGWRFLFARSWTPVGPSATEQDQWQMNRFAPLSGPAAHLVIAYTFGVGRGFVLGPEFRLGTSYLRGDHYTLQFGTDCDQSPSWCGETSFQSPTSAFMPTVSLGLAAAWGTW